MKYTLNLGEWNDIFAIPRSVVTKYIKLAKEDYLKVLLVLLSLGGNSKTGEELSSLSGVSISNIKDAICFWEEKGIIKSDENGKIEPSNKKAEITQTDPNKKANEIISDVKQEVKSREIGKNVKIKTPEPIKLSPFEISHRIETASDLKWLIGEAEKLLSKFLTQSETATLVNMFDYAGISADVIAMVIEYCVSVDKPNMRFIEKTAYTWADQGFDTHKKVEDHIKELSNQKNYENTVKSLFGIWDHNLSSKQKTYIYNWFNDLGFNEEMIKTAYEMCIDSTNKLSFPYIDKILNSWHSKNITNVSQVKENEESRKKESSNNTDSTFSASEFDDLKNYSVPNLSKKKNSKGQE